MNPLQADVSRRLRAVQQELGYNDSEMAKELGMLRTRWGNWVMGENMPEETIMVKLCDIAGITLDWIYRGRGHNIDARRLIRLELRFAGKNPDAASQEDLAAVAGRVATA